MSPTSLNPIANLLPILDYLLLLPALAHPKPLDHLHRFLITDSRSSVPPDPDPQKLLPSISSSVEIHYFAARRGPSTSAHSAQPQKTCMQVYLVPDCRIWLLIHRGFGDGSDGGHRFPTSSRVIPPFLCSGPAPHPAPDGKSGPMHVPPEPGASWTWVELEMGFPKARNKADGLSPRIPFLRTRGELEDPGDYESVRAPRLCRTGPLRLPAESNEGWFPDPDPGRGKQRITRLNGGLLTGPGTSGDVGDRDSGLNLETCDGGLKLAVDGGGDLKLETIGRGDAIAGNGGPRTWGMDFRRVGDWPETALRSIAGNRKSEPAA